MIQPHSQIQCQAALSDIPGVLEIQGLVCRIGKTIVRSRQTSDKEISVLTLAKPATVACLNRGAGCGAGRRSIALSPKQIDDSRIRGNVHVVILRLPHVTGLETVATPPIACKVRDICIETLPLEHVENRGEIIRDVGEPCIVEQSVGGEWVVVNVPAVRV